MTYVLDSKGSGAMVYYNDLQVGFAYIDSEDDYCLVSMNELGDTVVFYPEQEMVYDIDSLDELTFREVKIKLVVE